MDMALSLASQIGAMFIMIAVGFIMIKKEICTLKDCNLFSMIVLYVCGPCAIIKSFQLELTQDKVNGFLLAVAASIGIHVLYIVMTELLSKVFHFCNVEKASLIYSNAGNLIIPLVTLTMSEKMVFYCSAYMMVQIALVWTHCLSLIKNEKRFVFKKIIGNINILAIILGMSLFLLNIKLPVPISSAMSSMGAMMGPLSMFVVGMLLSKVSWKDVFANIRAYLIVLIRLIILPLMVLALFLVLRLHTLLPQGKDILMIVLLAAAAPSASTVTQFAQLYHNKPFEASIINALSILLCILTMPTIILVYLYFA